MTGHGNGEYSKVTALENDLRCVVVEFRSERKCDCPTVVGSKFTAIESVNWPDLR